MERIWTTISKNGLSGIRPGRPHKALEVLISRGLFRQAMGIIEERGCEGVDMRSLLKVTSRMILRSELAQDEELLALASQVYRSGIYDEVILKYLMEYRVGLMEELLAVRRSAVGFEMDTYELDERILKLFDVHLRLSQGGRAHS